MNYFLKGVFTGNRKFFFIDISIGIWGVAFLDGFTSGVLNGWFFIVTLIVTAVGFLTFIFSKYYLDAKKRKITKIVEADAAEFEPIRETEIRKLVKENPEFVTLCYECKYYDHNHRHCLRNMTLDITIQRLKEIRIGNTKYCLYWEIPSEEEFPEFDNKIQGKH